RTQNNLLWNNAVNVMPSGQAGQVGGYTIAPGSFSPGALFGGTGRGANDKMTINSGQAAFAMAVPTGFDLWGEFWTRFKLTVTLSSPQPALAGPLDVRVCPAPPQ